jgi:hypothetical protein
MRGSWFAPIALALMLGGCGVPGHTHDPAEAHNPLPVTFYAGHIVTAQFAAIGAPEGGIGLSGPLPNPPVLLGVSAGPGRQPGGGRATLTAGWVGFAAGVESPAQGIEYTVAVDGSPQIVQITQYILPEDCQTSRPDYPYPCIISPGEPVAIRVVGTKARVIPMRVLPPEYQGYVMRTAMPLPLGRRPLPALILPPRGYVLDRDGCYSPRRDTTCSAAFPAKYL